MVHLEVGYYRLAWWMWVPIKQAFVVLKMEYLYQAQGICILISVVS